MLTIILIIIIIGVVVMNYEHFFKKLKQQGSLAQNDIVLLKREYRKKYPEIGLDKPLKVVSTDGNNITVTYMNAKDIRKELVSIASVKKVS